MLAWLLLPAALGHAFLRREHIATDGTSRAVMKMKLQTRTRMKGAPAPIGEILTGTIKVGTPPQEFIVAVDTSSGNLMLPGKHCFSQACEAHRLYDVDLSTSGHQLAALDDLYGSGPPEYTKIGYARGQVGGTFVHDTVCIGSLCTQMDFLMADTLSDEPFNLVPYDGILGLGMPQMSIQPSFNLMGELAEDQALKHNQYSIWLARPIDGEDSELVFGDMDPARLGSQIVWMKTTSQPGKARSGFWQFHVTDFAVGNTKIEACGSMGCQAVADSSATSIGVPPAIHSLISEQANVRSDCSGFEELPNVGVVVDGYILNLRPQDYVFRSADGGSCRSAFYAMDIPPPKGPIVMLGVPFLTAFYSIYDRESLKIGLALAAHKDVELEDSGKLFVQLP